MKTSTKNITDNQITPAQLLTAAREGKITASVIDAETLPPLAGGDGPEQYPGCTISLAVDGQEIRQISAWKLVYYSADGDTLNGGRGTYDFRAVSSDECTRGDADAQLNGDGETFTRIEIETGEGCSSVDDIDVSGLTEEEQEEILEAIRAAIEGAYSDWSPEHPDESEIYAALVGKKRETTSIDAEIAGETISVNLYAGTHCGQPQYAYEGDESETVYEDSEDCAKAARERLEELLETAIEETEAMGEKEDDYGDYRIVADRVGKTVTIYSDDDKILENGDAMSDVGKAARSAFGRSADTQGRGCSVDNDHGWQWDVTGHGMDIDGHEGALDKQEREAAEALAASLKEE